MANLIVIAVAFFALVLLTATVYLLGLSVEYVRVQGTRTSTKTGIQYSDFLRARLTRRTVAAALVGVPAGFLLLAAAAIAADNWCVGMRLRSSLSESTTMLVRTGGFCHHVADREVVLFETTDTAEIGALLSTLSATPTIPRECRCCGELTFELHEGEQAVRVFSVHHGKRVRIQGDWLGDRHLSSESQQALENWLTERGIRQKLARVWERRKLHRESNAPLAG